MVRESYGNKAVIKKIFIDNKAYVIVYMTRIVDLFSVK